MGEATRRWSWLVAGAVTVGAIGVLPAAANATGAAVENGPASCDVYPIGVRSSVLASARAGDPIADLTLGAPTGHEGWLTWAGAVDEPTLGRSLTPPGDSERYVNPDDPTDHVVSVGDWVTGRPGSVSSGGVRKALDKLIGKPIVVPDLGCDPPSRPQRRVSRRRVRHRADHVVPPAQRQSDRGQLPRSLVLRDPASGSRGAADERGHVRGPAGDDHADRDEPAIGGGPHLPARPPRNTGRRRSAETPCASAMPPTASRARRPSRTRRRRTTSELTSSRSPCPTAPRTRSPRRWRSPSARSTIRRSRAPTAPRRAASRCRWTWPRSWPTTSPARPTRPTRS